MAERPLISAAELGALLPDPALVLLDARPSAADYEAGHLAGARHAQLDTQLSAAADPGADAARGGRHPLPPLERWLRQLGDWGIGPPTAVVIYDDQAGANAAARAWWMLRAIGHTNVSVLDGGLPAAVAAGLPLTTEPPTAAPLPPYQATSWNLPMADVTQVDQLRNSADWMVLDVRSGPRFRGQTEPIDPVAGHIPGARNLFFGDNLYEGRFKSPDDLRRLYHDLLGQLPPERLIVHCGSGVTACHTLLALEAAGLPGASLYVGSWSEWCRNELPQAKE
ncbi:MAG: Thiosulfate sulfurtransferase [Acidobacteria bacterium]|nr:Thiosulfate sulfurtransferase [Acidobacteriota bacterium]